MQAHIFHWQIDINHKHAALGEFYENYLDELDELAETIFGQTGKTFTMGKNSVEFMDYSEKNLKEYLMKVDMIFGEMFKKVFPKTPKNVGIYHVLGDIQELIGKLKYILSQK